MGRRGDDGRSRMKGWALALRCALARGPGNGGSRAGCGINSVRARDPTPHVGADFRSVGSWETYVDGDGLREIKLYCSRDNNVDHRCNRTLLEHPNFSTFSNLLCIVPAFFIFALCLVSHSNRILLEHSNLSTFSNLLCIVPAFFIFALCLVSHSNIAQSPLHYNMCVARAIPSWALHPIRFRLGRNGWHWVERRNM
jgi:hypothetical protein